MRVWTASLVLCLVSLGIPATARAAGATASCPSVAGKPAGSPRLILPPDAKPTSKEIAFEVDLGSDGRVRGLQMDEGSGDPAIDLSLRQTLQAQRYDPPQSGCVAYSGALSLAYGLPAPDAPQPTPPATLDTTCTPFVVAFVNPGPRDRKHTGTAVVAVELDAAGTQTGAPVLKQSTGTPALDAEALRIARAGQYDFVRGSKCAPQAFTYSLELTFQ